MCYKNVAPALICGATRPWALIQNVCAATRISPRWGSNTKCMQGYKNVAPLGL